MSGCYYTAMLKCTLVWLLYTAMLSSTIVWLLYTAMLRSTIVWLLYTAMLRCTIVLLLYYRPGLNAEIVISHKEPVTGCMFNPSFKQVITCAESSVSYIMSHLHLL